MQITCPCGKVFKVRDESVGKRVRCPGCEEPLLVEVPAATIRKTKPAASRREAARIPESAPPEPDEGRDGPRRHKKNRRSGPASKPLGLWLAIGGGVLAVAVAVILVVIVTRKPQQNTDPDPVAKTRQDPSANEKPPRKDPTRQKDPV